MALPPARAVTPYEFFTTIRLATVAEAVSGAGISFPTARRAAAGKALRKAAADKLEQWSRKLSSGKRAGAFIDRVLAVWPPKVN